MGDRFDPSLRVRRLQEGDFDRGASSQTAALLPLNACAPPDAARCDAATSAVLHCAGVLQLLAQLTVVGDVTREAFTARCAALAAGPEHVLVVEGARACVP